VEEEVWKEEVGEMVAEYLELGLVVV